MNMKQEIPVMYDDVKGWYALSNETFSWAMMSALLRRVYEINSQRLKGLTGDKRVRVENALERLKIEGISILADSKKGIDIFKANERVNKDKSYHFMGGN
jgi:hypothetical protein